MTLKTLCLACSLVFVLAACGDDDTAPATDSGTATDLGVASDLGPPRDLGPRPDLGAPSDSGTAVDAAAPSCMDACTHGMAVCPVTVPDVAMCVTNCSGVAPAVVTCVLAATDCATLDPCLGG